MLTRERITEELAASLEELFEVPRGKITPEARLYEDLDLDSIDAVDLVVKLQAMIGRRIKPEEFRAARTVADVVDCIERLLHDEASQHADQGSKQLA
jgi:acyl carrier protein